MMFHNKFAVAIKVGNDILRELGDQVKLPFGTEYTIVLKNLNSVRAIAHVHIDGKDVTDGKGLIVEPNRSVELERSISNGNMNSGNRFKFIARTKQIENHRGTRVDDGLVRVEYSFEKKAPEVINRTIYRDNYVASFPYRLWVYPTCPPSRPIYMGDMWNVNSSITSTSTSSVTGNSCNTMAMFADGSLSKSAAPSSQTRSTLRAARATTKSIDPGITVAGSVSNQQFSSGVWFALEATKYSIVLQLVGEIASKKVTKPITVRTKASCATCGKVSKSSNTFCGSCGTALNIL